MRKRILAFNNKSQFLINIVTVFSIVFFATVSPVFGKPSGTPFEGDGGKGITIAVLEPTGIDLPSDEKKWMTLIIQSSITGDFHKFSAMTIIDRQNLEKILDEQTQSMSGDYTEENYVRIGQIVNAKYILAGSVVRTTNAYMIEFSVTDVEKGVRIASYPPKQVSLLAIENLSAIKEATAYLLEKLGVILTSGAKQELLKTVDTQTVQAEMALARGINAQKKGTIVEALSYYISASGYDENVLEAASRINILSANISTGSIGDLQNENKWRKEWIERLAEADAFFVDYTNKPQPHYFVYSTDVKYERENINWKNETATLNIVGHFIPDENWANSINRVIAIIKNAFYSTKKAQEWGINWPEKSVYFDSQLKEYTIVIEIRNDLGKILGRQALMIPYGFNVKNGIITPLDKRVGLISFPGVNINDITDGLSITVASVDGLSARDAIDQKNLKIMTSEAYAKMLAAKEREKEERRKKKEN
jgi:TolB-like protein